MAHRASLHRLLASTALAGPIRATHHRLGFLGPTAGPVRVTKHTLAYVWSSYLGSGMYANNHKLGFGGGVSGPIRASGHYIAVARSLNTVIPFELLESNSELYPYGTVIEVGSTIVPEHNPYRPSIPEALIGLGDEFYNFYEENQNNLREQHNITQAGDTTFPWQMFVQTHSDKKYNLGVVSRFYHEDYGLIHGRYVQFDKMVTTTNIVSPVGLFKKAPLHQWRVTNQIELSDSNLVVGMIGSVLLPNDGEYGWVIVDGPSLQEVSNVSAYAEIGEAFAWAETGAVSNSAEGRVVGRRVNKTEVGSVRLGPGQLYIQIEGFSLESIRVAVIEATAQLAEDLENLQEDIEIIKALTTADETFRNLRRTLDGINASLLAEIAARKAGDISIRNMILNGFVTAAQLGAAVTNLVNSISTVNTALNSKVDAVKEIALEALAKANALGNLDALWEQVNLILTQLRDLDERPKGKFPVVDGSVPPNLVYLDDGSLVYTETF